MDGIIRDDICFRVNSELAELYNSNQVLFFYDSESDKYVLSTELHPGVIKKKSIDSKIVEYLAHDELITYLLTHLVDLSQPKIQFSRVLFQSIIAMVLLLVIIVAIGFGNPLLDILFVSSIIFGMSVIVVIVLGFLLPRFIFPNPDKIVYDIRPNLVEVLKKLRTCATQDDITALDNRIAELERLETK